MSARLACLLAAALLAGCGGEESADDDPAGSNRDAAPAAPIDRPAERCPGAATATDAADEGTALDLRQFELSSDARGVCVRWTTAEPAPVEAVLTFNAHGPQLDQPSGAVVSYGYGFDLELRESGPIATYGLDKVGSRAPRVLEVRVGRTGRTVSAFVARRELDRPPSNTPDRPPFPYRVFSVKARVMAQGELGSGDEWPDSRVGQAAWIDGALCAAPCGDPRLTNG